MDEPADLSSQDRPGWHLLDECVSTRNRKVEGSNPSSGSKSARSAALARLLCLVTPLSSLAALVWSHHNPLGAPPGC